MTRQARLAIGLGTAIAAAAAIAGCNKGGGGDARSYNEAPSSTAYTVTPGQYETTFRITNASAQNMPPEMQQDIQRAQQQGPITQRGCVPIGFSLDSLSVKNLRITFPQMNGQDLGGCNLGDLTQDGGNFHAALSCEIRNMPQRRPDAPRALNISGSMNGTYSANTWNGTAHGEFSEPGGNRSGNIDIEISSRRVGDCPASPPPMTYAPPPPSMNTMAPPSSYDGNMTMSNTTTTTTTNMSDGKM